MRRPLAITAFLLLMTLAVPTAGAAGPPDRYIVVLEQGASSPGALADEHRRSFGARPTLVYRHALKGYAATIPAQRVDDVRDDPRVAFVDRDEPVRAFAQQVPTGVQRIFAPGNAGLDIDGNDDNRVDADVAIIDTGIDYDHPELDVRSGTDCTGGGSTSRRCLGTAPADGDDGNGHGTHVAGTAAAIDNGAGVVGVAHGARLHAVKVLSDSGSGYTSWVIAGIDHVTANAGTIEVANMSLGGSGTDDGKTCAETQNAQKKAICNSVAAGVVYVVAAGNSDVDAAGSTPANHPDVITVSALADFDGRPGGLAAATCRSDRDDTLADFSNWGKTVELAAPGTCIRSTVPGGGYATYSGTSMASPHVAGAATLLASADNPSGRADVLAIRQALVSAGNLDWTDDSGDGFKEPLLDVSTFSPTLIPSAGDGGGDKGGGDGGTVGWDLRATPRKVKGSQVVDLTWTKEAAGATSVDIYRDGAKIVTATPNDGAYTDSIGRKGGGSYTYQVCGGGTCSAEVTVTF